ncbi:POT family-domain-containing protein [Chiua virens]|nr:POT family-domain-containing protein [Chiua virens]
MAGLELDRSIPAALAEHDQHLSSSPSLEKKDPLRLPMDDDDDDDSVHAGLEFPSEEELATLRRVSDALPWTAYMIAVVELAERFSYYGASAVFVNFIQQPLPPGSKTGAGGANGQSGALGDGHISVPSPAPTVADTYWGRYKTICWSVALAILGHIIMIISAIPGIIGGKPSTGLFILSLIITGTGAGGFKSNISPLVAEQYRRTKPFITTTKSGERVIVDPTLTASRIYMYFYLFINIGALIGQIGMVYAEKYVGYWLAYTAPDHRLPDFAHLPLAPCSVFGGTLSAAVGVGILVRCIRQLTADDFWESAKPSKVVGEKPDWMTFDDNWVDEVHVFLSVNVTDLFVCTGLCYNQLNNNLTSQAATMDTHGLPNDVLSNLDPFALIIFIPICDMLIYPALERRGWRFTALKKITWGFFTGAAAMTNPCGYSAGTCVDTAGNPLVSPLNVWIQTGSYVLIAFSEILASITGLEYAFTKAPRNMRSIIMSMFLFASAVSAALGEAFQLSIDPLLVWNYSSVGVLAGIAGVMFWLTNRKLDKEEDTLNNLSEGRFGASDSEKDQVSPTV